MPLYVLCGKKSFHFMSFMHVLPWEVTACCSHVETPQVSPFHFQEKMIWSLSDPHHAVVGPFGVHGRMEGWNYVTKPVVIG